MGLDFSKYFIEYEKLAALADKIFERVKNEYPKNYKCEITCCDCCYALFDIGFVEALYINHHFNEKFKEEKERRESIIEKANKADRVIYKLKKKSYKEVFENKKDENEIVLNMSLERIKCPLLNEENKCDLYEYRPIICRLYGIPISISGMSHTCGRSDFEEKKEYQTVKLEVLQKRLYEISFEIIQEIKSKYSKLAEMLVPVSMALLTDYNEEFLGLGKE